MAPALFIAPDAPAPPPLAFGTGLSLASSHPLKPPLSPHFVSGGCPRWRRRGRGRQWRWRRGGDGGKGGGGGNGGGEGPAAPALADGGGEGGGGGDGGGEGGGGGGGGLVLSESRALRCTQRSHTQCVSQTDRGRTLLHAPPPTIHSDLENVRLSTTSDTDGRHQTCAPLFSLPCMLGSRTLATRRCRAAAVFIHSFIQHHQLASRA